MNENTFSIVQDLPMALFAAALALAVALASSADNVTTVHVSGAAVTCETLKIPTLKSLGNRKAICCYPAAAANANAPPLPLHLFAHGDLGGGVATSAYGGLLRQIAAAGFVTVAYESCDLDNFCDNGETQFLEGVKTLQYLEGHPELLPMADFGAPYSASGHSTGARAVLMMAAVRDDPSYLANASAIAPDVLTPDVRATIAKIAAVAADHPDPMTDPKQNPDIPHWRIRRTPTFIITGQDDRLEPTLSAWVDFTKIAAPDKLYLNIANASHLQPLAEHPEGPYIAAFAQLFALGNASAAVLLYGSGEGSLQQRAAEGFACYSGRNAGDGRVGFVACGNGGPAVPGKFAGYCGAAAPAPGAAALA